MNSNKKNEVETIKNLKKKKTTNKDKLKEHIL